MATAAERPKAHDGPARTRAREIAEREVAAQRELQAQQRRIEVLHNFAAARFKRLNRTLTLSIVWIGLLGLAVLALGFFWHDIFGFVAEMFGAPPELPKGK